MSGGHGRCEDVRTVWCVHRGFVLPHGRVCFSQGESPVKLFGKLFGKSARQDGGSRTARHRASRAGEESGGGTEERPLFRDQVGAQGASVDPSATGPIGFQEPSAAQSGGGFGLPVCQRCGHRNADDPWYLTWFLIALFVWRLTTPLWRIARWP
ncbi:hypothetical protein ABZ554_47585, partial [Streptomyces sp. NPDC020125]